MSSGPTGGRSRAARPGWRGLKLAEQLGAANVVLTSDDLVASVLEYARRNNVTQIVVGKSHRKGWRERLGRSLAAALLREARGVAVHVITEPAHERESKLARPLSLGTWRGYAVGALFVLAATLVAWGLDVAFDRVDLGMIFLAAVLAAGVLHGLRPALAAATVAFFVYNYLFLEPRYSLAIGAPTDFITLIVFWAVALASGGLAGRVRDQALGSQRRAAAVTTLLAASRTLSAATGRDAVARSLAEQVAAAAGGRALVLLPQDGEIAPVAGSPSLDVLDAAQMAAARWAWDKGEAAGFGTGTLPQARWTFWPLEGVRARTGVAGVEAGVAPPGSDLERLVLALLEQGAVALERSRLASEAVEAETLRRADRFRSALMNSVSHDLRTPLSTVLGASTTLIDYGDKLTKPVREDLVVSIREEAERLNRYVANLLDMTRIEGGALRLRTDWIDARDVLNAAADRVARRLGGRPLSRDYPGVLSMVQADASLLEQVVVNVLENAIAYSPQGARIEMAAYEDRANVVVSIEDEGRGIPPAELERVFDKFRRMEEPSDRSQGAGLGLSIAKGFIDAMGGRIAAASPIHDGKGARILISLPKTVATPSHLL
jgi:two-component system sensor histidine kinase KdpD